MFISGCSGILPPSVQGGESWPTHRWLSALIAASSRLGTTRHVSLSKRSWSCERRESSRLATAKFHLCPTTRSALLTPSSCPPSTQQSRMESLKHHSLTPRPMHSITHHGESSADEHILRWRVMHRQRVCNAFTPWQQGFTPKEHREMVDRQWMIDREDRRDKEMRDREDRRDREAKSRHRNELVVFGLVLGALTIIGSMIQAGWFPKPW